MPKLACFFLIEFYIPSGTAFSGLSEYHKIIAIG